MRLLVEKTQNNEKIQEVFEQYMSAKAPYIKQSKGQESKTAEEVLTKIFESGPMVIDRRNQ